MDRHRIAIIVGSLREGSVNRKVAETICAMRDDSLDCSIIEIGDLPLYNRSRSHAARAVDPISRGCRGRRRYLVRHTRI